ncbi:TonB-dependent receptor plug domain-containing protein [Asticcacaulis sp.]|uniref:TonB-dependent receptor plug domain-containing protein n=1 Tax=Asticcacaulis sp. TaxID=1872648 RepID=UPI003F7C35C3
MKTIICAVSGLGLMAAGMAHGQAMSDLPAEIEVVVTGHEVETPDHLTYDITQDAEAHSGVIADILRKLPSVTLSPNGAVTLRGGAVTILVDGKAPPEGNAVIRNLPSGTVERIEIMATPSSQFAPAGTGGIINLITHRRSHMKRSGEVPTQINTLGQGNVSLSSTLETDRWTVNSQFYADHFLDRSVLYLHQEALNENADGYDITDREDHARAVSASVNGRLSVAWKLSDHAGLTFKGEAGRYDSVSRGMTYYRGLDDFDERSDIRSTNRHSDVQVLYDYTGDSHGEYLSLTAEHLQNRSRTASAYDQVGGYPYDTLFYSEGATDRAQGDYERRFGSGRLTFGASLDRVGLNLQSGSESAELAIGLADYFDGFSASRTLTALYATWQMPVGRWTVLSGLRAEREQLRLVDTGKSDVLVWYPSFHAGRDLTDKTRLKIDYSRRVLRPDLGEFDPGIRYFGAFKAFSGNPELKPQTTESYEIGYAYDEKDFGADATLYYRETRGSFTGYAELTDNGLLLTSRINSGRSRSGGLELTWRGPLSKRLSYSANGNLSYTEFPFADGGTRSRFGWSGNVLLEYDADNGDQYQLNATGYSRALTLQGYTRGVCRLDASYQHPLDDKLSLVVSATDIFNTSRFSTVVDTRALKTVSTGRPNLRALKIALTYRFGSGT